MAKQNIWESRLQKFSADPGGQGKLYPALLPLSERSRIKRTVTDGNPIPLFFCDISVSSHPKKWATLPRHFQVIAKINNQLAQRCKRSCRLTKEAQRISFLPSISLRVFSSQCGHESSAVCFIFTSRRPQSGKERVKWRSASKLKISSVFFYRFQSTDWWCSQKVYLNDNLEKLELHLILNRT